MWAHGSLHQPRERLLVSILESAAPQHTIIGLSVDSGMSIEEEVCWDIWGFLHSVLIMCVKRSLVGVILTGHLHQHNSALLGGLQEQIAHT